MLLRDAIYQAIRHAILTCEFQPGQELREQILAERYHVSRSPIRDSLLRLERENFVTVLPRQGYRVRPISASDVKDVFAFRLMIEPRCAAAAAHADDTALQALDRFRVSQKKLTPTPHASNTIGRSIMQSPICRETSAWQRLLGA